MMYVRMYVSVTLRNVAVTSRRNVASMMRIHRASNVIFCGKFNNIPSVLPLIIISDMFKTSAVALFSYI